MSTIDSRPQTSVPIIPKDMINRPPHYTQGKIEVIDFIADQAMGFLDGNIVKYVSNYRYSGSPGADLKEARRYLDKLIEKEGL